MRSHQQMMVCGGCRLYWRILNVILLGLLLGFGVRILLKSVKVDMVDNEHVKIYDFQVGGSGHSYQCLIAGTAPGAS